MDFRPLAEKEKAELLEALRGNATGERVLRMGRDTSFTAEVTDDEVISAIKSVPVHY